MPDTLHRLHLYTGDGKGKTSAAMGLAVRALGHGQRVLAAQFLKDGRSGELVSLAKLGAEVFPAEPVRGFYSRMNPEEQEAVRRTQGEQVRLLLCRVREFCPQTVVLDELAAACGLGAVSRENAEELIDACLAYAETAVTGRGAPEWLRDRADYLTELHCVRHPYETEKLPAREGVEW